MTSGLLKNFSRKIKTNAVQHFDVTSIIPTVTLTMMMVMMMMMMMMMEVESKR